MDELTLEVFISGPLLNNCYLVFDPGSKAGCLIDSPWDHQEVTAFLKKKNIEIVFLLLTHGHFDHIQSLDYFNCPFYIHRQDSRLIEDSRLNGSSFFDQPMSSSKKANFYSERPLSFGGQAIEVIHTPGHTPGSVSLKINKWLFSGDTLFFDSVGRTDVPLASQEQLMNSIGKKLLTLPEETLVYPGHGQKTTIGREKKYNPFLLDTRY
ncbi:MAG: MBL fold metallo-hydrolase [Candidatus Omnitrophica bacterium]|nr:MBL fold metallo-hydrolase [Candidatus Omnitrophota bacterium]MBU2250731.1 MBL fold metallo-hydrolase [Candidatus Omnitrophota bacterium]MBU2266320.1 MBL fold metallo-hydrolase [Candidatus Omnitrophota bacterium]